LVINAIYVQIEPDGSTIEVLWAAIPSGTTYQNLYLRAVNSDGSLGTLYQVTTDASATNIYVYTSMDYDSSGYRHIMAIARTSNINPDPANLWYIYQTGAGWQARVKINSDGGDSDLLHYPSNILINKNDEKFIMYDIGPFTGGAQNPLYIKKISSAGVVGARTVVEAGSPTSIGGTIPQIQLDENNDIIAIYMSNGSPDTYNSRTISPDLATIGSRQRMYSALTGYELSYFHIPWSIPPSVGGINPNVPQQNMMMVSADYQAASPAFANIRIHYLGNAVFGSPTVPDSSVKHTFNIRGAINKTKFNSGFSPALI